MLKMDDKDFQIPYVTMGKNAFFFSWWGMLLMYAPFDPESGKVDLLEARNYAEYLQAETHMSKKEIFALVTSISRILRDMSRVRALLNKSVLGDVAQNIAITAKLNGEY